MLPPMAAYPHTNGFADPRTAPISHVRNGEEFARQQYPFYPTQGRPRGSFEHASGAHTSIPSSANRRNLSVPGPQQPIVTRFDQSHERRPANPRGAHSRSPVSPPPPGHRRESFLQPFNQLYDLTHQADTLRFSLQELLQRCEGVYHSQAGTANEFKKTAAEAGAVLGSLQQSADSLKKMVRYEVERAGSAAKTENEELKEKVRKLEERLEKLEGGKESPLAPAQ